MKTTLDLSEDLLGRMNLVATPRGITIDALVEEGLTSVLAEQRGVETFVLRDAGFGGAGLQADAPGWSWKHLSRFAY